MHINALETRLMHKNVQPKPQKSQKLTQHSCCSMLTREKNLKAIRGNGYRFVPKNGTFPTENHHGCCEDYLTCDIAFNAVMPLGRASTRARYSRIEGVTH